MSSRKVSKVLVTWASPEWRTRIEESLRGPEFAHVKTVFTTDRAEILREIRDADVAFAATFDLELLRAGERLQWIHLMRGGIDNVLFPELVAAPIQVTCLKDLFAAPGAEFAAMAMLMVQRRMTAALGKPKMAQSSGPLDLTLKPQDLAGCTAGLLGLGNMGRRIAGLARAFQMRVLGLARRAPADASMLDEYFPIERAAELLAESDFAVLALPVTPETKTFFNEKMFAAMKPGSWLIDVSGRPALIDYAAMQAALDSGHVGGVFLQPTGPQAGVPAPDDKFWQRENVVVYPCRGTSSQQQDASVSFFPDNLRRFERGEPLRGLVDKVAGY